jgi:hypothetical protein
MSINENIGQQMTNSYTGEFDAVQKRLGNLAAGANPLRKKTANVQGPVDDRPDDWRVSLQVPTMFLNDNSEVLAPLKNSQNKMIFPFTPTIILGHSANYSTITPTHSNYPFYAYQNSQVDTITINGDFFTENEDDARYWLACIHFLRTMTKMFYGDGADNGKPPPMSRLNGYGKYVMNNVPVLITSFTTDLPADVDYIPCTIPTAAGPSENYVPTQSTITVQVAPNYARRSVAGFSLQDFANGNLVGKQEGFI